MRRFLFILFFIPNTVLAQQVSAMRNSMVKIFVHKQEMDVHEPWKNGHVYTEEHIGTVVSTDSDGEKGILIKASALSFAKRIEMQALPGIERIELLPHFVDSEVNLAVLEAVDSEALRSFRPVMISEQELPIEDEVFLFSFDTEDHIIRIRSTLRTVNFGERMDTSSYPTINYVFKVPRKDLGWSEPVLSKGRLVALAVGEDEDDNVHCIPGSLVYHFLKDSLDEDYRGFPTAGIEYTSLSSPHTRDALGLDKKVQGVLINEVKKNSSFDGQIKKGDVLITLDGRKINTNGTTTHYFWGEMPTGSMLYKRYAGDKISIEVLRNKKILKFTAPLKRYDSNGALIPYYLSGKVPFLIAGGLVFQELNRPYLRAWGKNWLGDSPSSLSYLWHFKNDVPEKKGEHIILLSQILADLVNKGYEGIGNAVVDSVNNKPIHSLADLKEALEKPVSKNNELFAQIKLGYGEGELILPMKDLKEANLRIGSNYGINDKTGFFNPLQ